MARIEAGELANPNRIRLGANGRVLSTGGAMPKLGADANLISDAARARATLAQPVPMPTTVADLLQGKVGDGTPVSLRASLEQRRDEFAIAPRTMELNAVGAWDASGRYVETSIGDTQYAGSEATADRALNPAARMQLLPFGTWTDLEGTWRAMTESTSPYLDVTKINGQPVANFLNGPGMDFQP